MQGNAGSYESNDSWVKDRRLRRIELSVAHINEKAIRLYEKTGFQKEGVLRDYCWLKSENRYMDEVMMAYIVRREA